MKITVIIQRVTRTAVMSFLMTTIGIYSNTNAGAQAPPRTTDAESANPIIMQKLNNRAIARPVLDINSEYPELKPNLSPSGDRLYFSRFKHPGNHGTSDLEDIWFAEFDSTTLTWSEPAVLDGTLNNEGPNYINNITLTGDTVLLGNRYSKKGKMSAGVSISVRENNTWSEPQAIEIKNEYNIAAHGNFFLGTHGVILSAVERDGTRGSRDLYVSFWNGKQATRPINLGNTINSELEESSPFLSEDNKTLFFASKGHSGFGGFDIYVSERLDDTWQNWSEPKNLGSAINGPFDEQFFSVSAKAQCAFFSKQVTGGNDDIYQIRLDDLFFSDVVATAFR